MDALSQAIFSKKPYSGQLQGALVVTVRLGNLPARQTRETQVSVLVSEKKESRSEI